MTAESLASPWLAPVHPERLEQAAQVPLPDYSRGARWRLKRTFDVIVSSVGLVLFLPVILVIALLIKRGSPGPIFFRQQRITRRGRRFNCLKFRTMDAAADPTPHLRLLDRLIAGYEVPPSAGRKDGPYKLVRDPRITSTGRWLRKTSLDELPQLWNVLQGDLSLVGPLAPIAFEVERYPPEWLARLSVPMGLTGPWQVYGRARVTYADMIELDLEYIRSWSLRNDLKLLILTIPSVIVGRGAR
jgi:lipopolysaccharide/colanic/teichoic acid biosynthesis glycosyltransferase